MKVKTIKATGFKRFTDLTVTDIPESTRLVILVGPNGCGKTSLFEAFNHWYKFTGFSNYDNQEYFEKLDSSQSQNYWYQDKVKIEFHGKNELKKAEIQGKFYFRSAYRNEADFTVNGLNKQGDPTKSIKLSTLMQNDQTVSENYQRLVSATLSGVFNSENNDKTVEHLREELIGKIKQSLSVVFDDLNLSSIGDPLANGSFYFEKGSSKDFHYKNLSAGEKSVFDLVLDMIVKAIFYPEAIFCIDEPEAHMHTRLQGRVLRELFNLTPINSQLWISTHSIGMLKQAEQIEKDSPGSVVFLDFDNRDFDSAEVMTPAVINNKIWDRFFELALADFAQLIAPKRIVLCEGNSQGRKYRDFDAQIYARIFEGKYHDTRFISIGSASEIEKIENQSVNVVANILKSSEIVKFIDRDERTSQEISELQLAGVRTSKRRHIESYLFDDEIISKLCDSVGRSDAIPECLTAKQTAVRESIARGNPIDDIKSASGNIFTELKRILALTQSGNNKCAFSRDTLTPLITSETKVFAELEAELFG